MVSHDLLTISSYAKTIACVNKRLHCHQAFGSSKDLLNAFYSCSVEEICPVETVSQNLQKNARIQGESNA
jgi:zinc transport system ATP-binding protein